MNKRRFIVFTIVCFQFFVSTAQNSIFSFEINAGPSLVLLNVDDQSDKHFQSELSYCTSANVRMDFLERFSAKAGIEYTPKGDSSKMKWTNEAGETIKEYKIKYSFEYISIPINIRYIIKSEKYSSFIETGFFYGILLNQYLYDPELDLYQNHTTDSHKTDYGLGFGIGCEYSLSNTLALSFGIHNRTGIKNINKINNSPIRTNSTSLLVGIVFYPLK